MTSSVWLVVYKNVLRWLPSHDLQIILSKLYKFVKLRFRVQWSENVIVKSLCFAFKVLLFVLYSQAAMYKKSPPSEADCLLLGLELLYVWRALYTCSETVLNRILSGNVFYHSAHLILRSLLRDASCCETFAQKYCGNDYKCLNESATRHCFSPCGLLILSYMMSNHT